MQVRISFAVVFFSGLFLLGHHSLAQDAPSAGDFSGTIDELRDAKTLSFTQAVYQLRPGKDGSRAWVLLERSQLMYQAPGKFRDTRFDKQGEVVSVEIVDTVTEKVLRIDMPAKKGYWLHSPTNVYESGSPTANLASLLQRVPKPAVSQQERDGKKIDVYRLAGRRSLDLWLDASSNHLVGMSVPGGDQFDPDAEVPADSRPSVPMGRLQSDIVYGRPIKPEMFAFEVPEGFESVPAPSRPTEGDLLEWLEVTAKFGGGVYHETQRGFDMQELARGRNDPERAKEYEALNGLIRKHMLNRNLPLVRSFIKGNVVPGSFHYAGDGVKLGDSNALVCWYKDKQSGKFRAIYGDLSAKEIKEQDLPSVDAGDSPAPEKLR